MCLSHESLERVIEIRMDHVLIVRSHVHPRTRDIMPEAESKEGENFTDSYMAPHDKR